MDLVEIITLDSSVQILGETINTPRPYDEFMESSDKSDEISQSLSDFINDDVADLIP